MSTVKAGFVTGAPPPGYCKNLHPRKPGEVCNRCEKLRVRRTRARKNGTLLCERDHGLLFKYPNRKDLGYLPCEECAYLDEAIPRLNNTPRLCDKGKHVKPGVGPCRECARERKQPKPETRRGEAWQARKARERAHRTWLDWVVVMRVLDGVDPGRQMTHPERRCVAWTLRERGWTITSIATRLQTANHRVEALLAEPSPTLWEAIVAECQMQPDEELVAA